MSDSSWRDSTGSVAPSRMAWRMSESRERMAWTTAVWLYCVANAWTAGNWSTRSTDGNTAATCGLRAWTTDGSPCRVNTNTHRRWFVEPPHGTVRYAGHRPQNRVQLETAAAGEKLIQDGA